MRDVSATAKGLALNGAPSVIRLLFCPQHSPLTYASWDQREARMNDSTQYKRHDTECNKPGRESVAVLRVGVAAVSFRSETVAD
jgi:hypothetical protein